MASSMASSLTSFMAPRMLRGWRHLPSGNLPSARAARTCAGASGRPPRVCPVRALRPGDRRRRRGVASSMASSMTSFMAPRMLRGWRQRCCVDGATCRRVTSPPPVRPGRARGPVVGKRSSRQRAEGDRGGGRQRARGGRAAGARRGRSGGGRGGAQRARRAQRGRARRAQRGRAQRAQRGRARGGRSGGERGGRSGGGRSGRSGGGRAAGRPKAAEGGPLCTLSR